MRWDNMHKAGPTYEELGIRPSVLDKVIIAKLVARTLLVPQQYLDTRRIGAVGQIWGIVTGAGGDEWWVLQDDGVESIYRYDEMAPIQQNVPGDD